MSSTSNQPTGAPPAQPNFHQEIAVDETVGRDDDDLDSALGSDASVRGTSVTSSIYSYRFENGRRYHAYRDGKYLLPNDEAEQDRLDLHHHVFSLVLSGRLFRAPINNPQRVLDFGTGTGMWAIDMADDFASAVVIGTDLSPIQPDVVPPNCIFYVDDFESEWTFGPDEAFDFIHGRGIGGSVNDFGLLYSRIYRNLKPGGWVEVDEYESYISSDDDPNLEKIPNITKWLALCNEASAKFGKSISIAPEQKQYMIDAGFHNVRDDIYKVPIGTWPAEPRLKEIGMYQREHVLLCVESFTLGLLGRVMGWSNDECQVLMAEVRRELRDPKLRLYTVFHFVIGRRPEPAGKDLDQHSHT